MEETKLDLLKDLNLTQDTYQGLESLVKGEHRYIRDLRINLKNALNAPTFESKKEAYLIALSVAVNEKSLPLIQAFSSLAKNEGATDQELAESQSVASLLASLNVFYRFKHFSDDKSYESMPAGIKMSIMARPVLGKPHFELMSLAVSAVNGCETCVVNHEKSVKSLGISKEKIFDTVRLAAIVKGASVLF